jgi:CheY-like chemotaxis protein
MQESMSVLLADDNLPFRETLREIICMLQPGWRVIEAGDGLEAIQLAEAKSPRLIFLDFNMPIMSGYEVAITLQKKSETATIPLVLMTSEDTDNPLVHRLSALCAAVLYKPFSLKDLERLINRVLANKSTTTTPSLQMGQLLLEAV